MAWFMTSHLAVVWIPEIRSELQLIQNVGLYFRYQSSVSVLQAAIFNRTVG